MQGFVDDQHRQGSLKVYTLYAPPEAPSIPPSMTGKRTKSTSTGRRASSVSASPPRRRSPPSPSVPLCLGGEYQRPFGAQNVVSCERRPSQALRGVRLHHRDTEALRGTESCTQGSEESTSICVFVTPEACRTVAGGKRRRRATTGSHRPFISDPGGVAYGTAAPTRYREPSTVAPPPA
jgi:hypothetical protein